MKKLLLYFLAILFLNVNAQSKLSDSKIACATTRPMNYKQWRDSLLKNNVSTLKHDQCVNKKYSIVFYIVLDSLGGTGGITPAVLDTCVLALNKVFKRICITFMNCSTVKIPHHPYNVWYRDSVEQMVTKNWWTENTINLYLPDEIVGAAGYASMPGSSGKELVVIKKPLDPGVAIHEFGHFFGLPHTFDEINNAAVSPPPPPTVTTKEFVRRTPSNCYFYGDGFCDTEADCFPVNVNIMAPCEREFGATDGWGDYYVPPVDNFMTYFKCSCRFTQEQYNFMALTALTALMQLH